jgi:hypothetical protein
MRNSWVHDPVPFISAAIKPVGEQTIQCCSTRDIIEYGKQILLDVSVNNK